MLDYRNSDELANHLVWIPFHFLPGNGGKVAGEDPDEAFINKLICYPDSHIARDMLRACANDFEKPYALHRLGVTMHVYADTWAHQGFAGINHKINEIVKLKSNDQDLDASFINKMANHFMTESFPLGHGAALSYPDRPSLIWEYTNGFGEKVERDNPAIFIDAVDKMCRAMQCFVKKDKGMDLEAMSGVPEHELEKIRALLTSIQGETGEIRHEQWREEIKNGTFIFGAEEIRYIPMGKGSWKSESLGEPLVSGIGREKFVYEHTFMRSDWKLFHDALQAHRFDLLHDILPKYGICAA